ncbi:helix-turn-helix domain-containing protein [Aeromonas sp. 604282]|uniref:helix-turn-helix domain-containing protein n=1 Tax=Aeromonas sp. 604282 TaxID=2712053 RepID=UPI003BA0D3E0
MSGRKIAELFKMGQRTVADIIAAVSENPESGKPLTPEVSTSAVPMASTEDRPETRSLKELMQNAESAKCITPEVSNSTVPMASTEDRSDTREDARS